MLQNLRVMKLGVAKKHHLNHNLNQKHKEKKAILKTIAT